MQGNLNWKVLSFQIINPNSSYLFLGPIGERERESIKIIEKKNRKFVFYNNSKRQMPLYLSNLCVVLG
jgi:hypothetical protein